MYKILLYFILTQNAYSDDLSCYQLTNKDLKQQCLAIKNNNSLKCYDIKNPTQKNYCLGKLENKSNCYKIKDINVRIFCLQQ